MFWNRLFRNRMGMVGLAVILVNVLMAALAPWIATHDPLKVDVVRRSAPPSQEFWFGTDDFGRDIFSRVIYGSRISLEISVLSVLAWKGRYSPGYYTPVENAGLYWHFVDVVWIGLYIVVYWL